MCLSLVALWSLLFAMLTIPLQQPSAMDVCAEPCFPPPPTYGAVVAGATFASTAAAISVALGAAAVALLSVAAGSRPVRPRRLLLAPLATAGLVLLAVGVVQAIAAL